MSKYTEERWKGIIKLTKKDWERRNGKKWDDISKKKNDEVDCYGFETEDRKGKNKKEDKEYDGR